MSNSLPRMLQIHSHRGANFRDVVALYPLHYLDDTSLALVNWNMERLAYATLSEHNLCVTSAAVVLVMGRYKTQNHRRTFCANVDYLPFPREAVKRPRGKLLSVCGRSGLAHMRCVHGSQVRRVITKDLWALAHLASPTRGHRHGCLWFTECILRSRTPHRKILFSSRN